MDWHHRFNEWEKIYNAEAKKVGRLTLSWKLFKTILTGVVPREVYLHRLRICQRCPVYNPVLKQCRPEDPRYAHLGCGCYVPFSALTARPYSRGCWGRDRLDGIGWPAYVFARRVDKWREIVRFILRK